MKKQYIKPTVEVHELKLKQIIMASNEVTIQTQTYEEAAEGDNLIDL